tara:strand:- start:3132 stop:5138 length:2007 start_codon:yes stop_codon:yes gene_type:complete
MSKFKRYNEWLNKDLDENLNESLGAENTTPPVNDDLEDIRFFKGGVAQLNDWLNKKLESQNKTWNPYAEMNYKHPVERYEKDDSIGYQDYNHGKDSAPENAKATRRRGSKVDPAKFPSSLDEAIELVHVYKDGELFGTGEIVKGKDKKINGKNNKLIRFDGKKIEYYPEEDVKLVESVNEELVNGGDHYRVGDTITFRLKREAITGEIEKIKNNKKDPASSELEVRHQKGYTGPSKRYYTDTIYADQIVVSDSYGKWSIKESVNEATFRPNSGTMSGGTYTLDDNKYELKKDVKGAIIGNNTNITLPKGTVLYNLPGGLMADHESLKRYANRNNNIYFEKPNFSGIAIRQTRDILAAIEKNSKVLESVNEATDGWHDVKHKYAYDPNETTTIDGTVLTNGITMRKFMKIWKKDVKLEKKIGGSPDGSLVNYYAKQSYEMAVYLYNQYGFDFEVEFYRSSWNYGGHINPTYYLKGPWETRKAPIQINTGRAGSTGSVSFHGILDGIGMEGAGYRSSKVEAGVHYSWQVYPVKDMSELFEIIYKSFERTFDMEMTAKNMVTLGKGFVKLRKAWMKIWGTGGKLDKAYIEFADLRPRKNFGIYYSRPELFPKYVKWYIDLPREFRHPDEYGGQEHWSDKKWEVSAAEEKVSSIIFDFCNKHGIDATISADK